MATAFAVVLTPVLYHGLGPERFAIYAFAMVLVLTLEGAEFGLLGSVARFVAHYRAAGELEELRRLVSSAFFAAAALGLLFAAGIALLAPAITNFLGGSLSDPAEAQRTIALFGATLLVQLPAAVLIVAFHGCEDFRIANGIDIVVHVLRGSSILLVVWMGYGLVALAVIFVVVGALRGLLLLLWSRRAAVPFRPRWSLAGWSSLRRLGSFAPLTFCQDSLVRFYWQSDVYIAARLLPLAEVSLLVVARRLPMLLLRVMQQALWVTVPAVTGAAAGGRQADLHRFLVVATRNLSAVMLAMILPLFFWADQVLHWWMRQPLPLAALALRLLLVWVFFSMLQQIASHFFYAIGRLRVSAPLTVLLTVGAVAGGIAGTSLFGLAGLVAAYALAQVAGGVALFSRAMAVSGAGYTHLWRSGLLPLLWPTLLLAIWYATCHAFLPATPAVVAGAIAAGTLLFTLLLLQRLSVFRSDDATWPERLRRAALEAS